MEKWVRDLMHVHYGLDAQLLPKVVDHALIVCQVGCIVNIRGSLPCLPNEEQPVHMCICLFPPQISTKAGVSPFARSKLNDMKAAIKLLDCIMQAA